MMNPRGTVGSPKLHVRLLQLVQIGTLLVLIITCHFVNGPKAATALFPVEVPMVWS